MRTSTILVIFGCIIASSFASYAVKKTPTFKFDSSALNVEGAEKKPSFGDLLTLFQTHDFQDNSALHQFLDTLKERIQTERAEHQAIYDAQKEACQSEVEFRNNEIQAAQESYDASQAHKDLCSTEKLEAESLKQLAENALVIYEQQLEELIRQREIQYQLYQDRKAKLHKALDAIHTALSYVDELAYEALDAGFRYTTQLLQLTNTLLAVSVQTKQTNKVLPVYNKLLQVHNKQKFSLNDVDELRNLFQQILQNVVNADEELDRQERIDEENFVQRKNELLEILERLHTQIALSYQYIDKMEACIEQETSISEMAQDKITRNKDLLEHAEKLCQDNENEWTEGENARNHQIQLLNQLKWALDQLSEEYQAKLLEDADPYKQGFDIGA